MSLTILLRLVLGTSVGGIMGYGFGLLQRYAHSRHQRLQDAGKLNSGWAIMPGSMKRVVYLLIALMLVQVLCPLFFQDWTQWSVSVGVALGYGVVLYLELRRRLAENR